jgi:leader peptidase (prepilin peptidase)/N-methyltransferase
LNGTVQEELPLGAPHVSPIVLAALSPGSAAAIFAVWLLAFGGAVGSFLNVVVYRLPIGKSLLYPGSHCPACSHPIRWYDNVPVLAWFLLRGRCRDCGSGISLRYPVVEAITAGVFLLVGWIEGLGGGANLPLPPEVGLAGTTPPLLGIGPSAGVVGYHLLLLCTLLAAGLIEHDGHGVPWRLFVPALLVGWLAPLVWPYLHPVCAERGPGGGFQGGMTALADGTAGLAVGLLLGLGLSRLPGATRGRGTMAAAACVGVFLGWKGAVLLTPAALVLWLLLRVVGRPCPALRRFSPTIALGGLALVWILAWGRLASYWPWLGEPLF